MDLVAGDGEWLDLQFRGQHLFNKTLLSRSYFICIIWFEIQDEKRLLLKVQLFLWDRIGHVLCLVTVFTLEAHIPNTLAFISLLTFKCFKLVL